MDRDFDHRDGKWFPVMNELADKLITCDLTKIEHRVLWMFFRYCYGYNKPSCQLQWKDMKEITGFADGSLSKAINRLKQRNILHTFHTESKTYVTYKINSKISTWKKALSIRKDFPYGKQTLHIRKVNTSHTESVPIKDIKTIKTTAKPEKIVLPVWLDKEVWKEFKKYRQNGRGKFTRYAQKLAINKLKKFKEAGSNPSEVIKQSILHGWSGLFEIKKEIREEAQEKQKTNAKLQEYIRKASL